jgi:hypothetical protein
MSSLFRGTALLHPSSLHDADFVSLVGSGTGVFTKEEDFGRSS